MADERRAGVVVRGQVSINGLESFRASLKRRYTGTFDQISPRHLKRYVAEYSGRHNARPPETIDQMRDVAGNLIGKRLACRVLIGR
ncbi:MAG: transposase [Proteobacteria bacterium]|nr:transposase [Pseudomonadota bacterium]MYJ96654.1 transposase [Pseudomonadota bacterium]